MNPRVDKYVLTTTTELRGATRENNKVRLEDRAAHGWYRFVLSYPPHLVRDYVERFGLGARQRVLDPFCGTGTTVVECKKLGVKSVGIEANPMPAFASEVKTEWTVDPKGLMDHARRVSDLTCARLARQGIEDIPALLLQKPPKAKLRGLPEDTWKLLLKNCISPLPLHKTLVLMEVLEKHHEQKFWKHERLALAKALVGTVSNLHFGPEVGVGKPKSDAPVVAAWLNCVRDIADDLVELQNKEDVETVVHRGDARNPENLLRKNSIDAVITSPPYPNEKDYTRTTRLESVLLGFVNSKDELRALKKAFVRSNTRSVYKTDEDDLLVEKHQEIQRIADQIEKRRIELGKTSGFERLYHRVTKLYFGGMKRHLTELQPFLRPGAQLAYVVGDQASYLRVMIRTGQLLAGIGESLGYEVMGIDLFRTRLATATKEQLREEIVLLRWPGKNGTK